MAAGRVRVPAAAAAGFGAALSFAFTLRITLVTHRCFSGCSVLLTPIKAFPVPHVLPWAVYCSDCESALVLLSFTAGVLFWIFILGVIGITGYGTWHCYNHLKGIPGSDLTVPDTGFQRDFRVYLQLRQR